MAEIKLKPCPFCGGEAKIIGERVNNKELYLVKCRDNDCDVQPFTDSFRSMDRAIKAWNTRAENIVHCRDCKHLMFSDCYGECRRGYLGIVSPDDFCSRGERREDK